MSAAKSSLSTSEQVSEDLKKFIYQLDLIDQIRGCVLWHPESDFSRACPCDQCGPKIKRLMDFEKEIQAKKELLQKYYSQMDDKEVLCLAISSSAEWTRRMLYLFQNKLKAVNQELGVTWRLEKCSSAAKIENVDEEIAQMLIDAGLLSQPDEKKPFKVDAEDSAKSVNVLEKTDTGYYHYSKTKAKEKAFAIIKDIIKLENDHNMDKKIAEAQNQSIDPQVSKKYIEEQIKLLKTMPVDELLQEVIELIAEIKERDHVEFFQRTREFISKTCFAMIRKSNKFWQGAHSQAGEKATTDHNSNGFKETLDSLITEVNTFEAKWRDECAHVCTPYDRSNPKRQATG